MKFVFSVTVPDNLRTEQTDTAKDTAEKFLGALEEQVQPGITFLYLDTEVEADLTTPVTDPIVLGLDEIARAFGYESFVAGAVENNPSLTTEGATAIRDQLVATVNGAKDAGLAYDDPDVQGQIDSAFALLNPDN